MARITLSAQVSALTSQVADLQRELELTKRQLANAATEKGVLLESNTAKDQRIDLLKSEIADCHDEMAKLESALESYAHRCDALEEIVSTQSASQPQCQVVASRPLPSSTVVESAPTIEVSNFDRAMWRKFQELPRETRLEIIDFARPEWGHVGIHNIVEIRAAWHNAKPISA